jgi:hypothetical protein
LAVLVVISSALRRLDGHRNPDAAAMLCSAMRMSLPSRQCSYWRVALPPQPWLRRRVTAMASAVLLCEHSSEFSFS